MKRFSLKTLLTSVLGLYSLGAMAEGGVTGIGGGADGVSEEYIIFQELLDSHFEAQGFASVSRVEARNLRCVGRRMGDQFLCSAVDPVTNKKIGPFKVRHTISILSERLGTGLKAIPYGADRIEYRLNYLKCTQNHLENDEGIAFTCEVGLDL